ncbi:MAG: hypothetical protein LBT27_05175 [Prevotellaceae bacterium]|jgi:hypothetical protein|nr:hypothetical protein [Prevotellaceae bacterium]
MKTKDAIRNDIVRYANFVWQNQNLSSQNSLVQLMIEEICNEVYLLNNKLDDTNYFVLKKLVSKLTPSSFGYVRPAHGILYVKTDEPEFNLEKRTNFFIKVIPDDFKEKEINSIIFTPITDMKLINANITHFFFDKTLWSIDNKGNKDILFQTDKQIKHNTVWLGLNIDKEIKSLENLYFYIQFPHLDCNHEYYDILQYLQWNAGNKPLKMKQGLPVDEKVKYSKTENELLEYYKTNYQTIGNKIRLNELKEHKMPEEFSSIADENFISAFSTPLYWISISFPPHFHSEDIEKMTVLLNVFPVVNRHYNENNFILTENEKTISLPSDIGEEFLEMNRFSDAGNNTYKCVNTIKEEGEYIAQPIPKKDIEDPRIADYLERLIDVVQDESVAFSKIDKDKMLIVYNAISSLQNSDSHKVERNWLNEYADVAMLTVKPKEDTKDMTISWWTTYAERLNDIPEGTLLMAYNNAILNKTDAVFLTRVHGGKSFYDFESLKAINRFYTTSHDRILTKHNILNFCRIELGKYVENIDVVKNVRISHKRNEGMLNVIEIQIKPRPEYADYLQNTGILKELYIRLRQRSPDTFNYKIILS